MADEPTAPRASLERFVPAVLAVIVLCLAVGVWLNVGAVAGAADSSGYLNSARLLARGEFATPIRPVEGVDRQTWPDYVDEIYAPLGFRAARRDGSISPIYPTGLPLLMAAAARVTNWDVAPGLVLVIHAIAGVLLVYALGREFGLPRGWSALGALLLAVSPLYFHMSLWTMSDVPALTWTTAGLLAAWRAQRHPAWALAAGFALGAAVLVRPTNVLALLPAIVALGWDVRRALLLVAGGAPAAGWLACYNFKAYGGVLTSGYFNPPDTFAWHHAAPTLLHYAIWLPVLLTPLGLAALALPWARNVGTRAKWMLGLWALAFLGFYAIYSFTQLSWGFLRFLLPAFPPLIVAALLVLRDYAGRRPWRVSPAITWAAVAAIVTVHGLFWTRHLHASGIGQDEKNYPATARWMQSHLPPRSVVLAMQNSGALFYYTDLRVVSSVWFQPEQFRLAVPVLRAAGHPIYAVLQDFEQDDALTRHIPGNWVKVERVLKSTVWRLEP